MKKLIIALILLLSPITAFARGGGPVGGGSFHSSPSVHVSEPSFSSSPSTFHSYSTPSTHSYSSYSSEEEGSYSTGGVTKVYTSGSSGSDFWFWMWLISHDNNQQYSKDNVSTQQDHFPYVLILDQTAKDYMLVRYIGPNNKTEKVSPQEAAGLTWLKGEIKY